MRELVRRNLRFFVIASLAALGLRLFFVLRFPGVVTDSFIYGDIAKNWLEHGIYGLSGTDGISPTYIRLPGYPAFLAFIFAIFGTDHYRAALVVQVFVDLGTCFLCADIARRLFGLRCAKLAFVLDTSLWHVAVAGYLLAMAVDEIDLRGLLRGAEERRPRGKDSGVWRPLMIVLPVRQTLKQKRVRTRGERLAEDTGTRRYRAEVPGRVQYLTT